MASLWGPRVCMMGATSGPCSLQTAFWNGATDRTTCTNQNSCTNDRLAMERAAESGQRLYRPEWRI
jgi:hypothetical protein